jgi:outer membrane protein TolC
MAAEPVSPHAPHRGLVPLGLFVLVLDGCYREARTLETPEARLAWIRTLRPVVATEPSPPTGTQDVCGPLTEAALIERALTRDAAITEKRGEARVLEAEAEVSLAGTPQLRISNLRVDRLIDGPERLDLGLRFPFERPGTLDARADEIRRDADRVRAEGDEVALETRYAVRVAWSRLAVSLEIEAVLQDDVTLAEAEVARLGAGSRQREVALQDLAAAERERLDASTDLGRARSEVARWRAELTRLTGCEVPATRIELPDGRSSGGVAELEHVPEADEAPEAALDRALAEHPRLAQRAAARRAADARRYEARAQSWPWLAWAQVGYELDSDHDARAFAFAFGIDLPLFAWDGAALDHADTELRAIDEVAAREADTIARAIAAARTEVRAQRDALAALTKARNDLDPQRLEALRKGVAQGFVDPIDVFRLDRELHRLERRRLEIVENLALARARLLLALGR